MFRVDFYQMSYLDLYSYSLNGFIFLYIEAAIIGKNQCFCNLRVKSRLCVIFCWYVNLHSGVCHVPSSNKIKFIKIISERQGRQEIPKTRIIKLHNLKPKKWSVFLLFQQASVVLTNI